MQERLICDFSKPKCLDWYSVDDGVMGGVSQSRFTRAEEGIGHFHGELSDLHGGGFASVRTFLDDRDFSGLEGIRLRVKGDGRRYSFRIRNDDRFDGIVYKSDFTTLDGEWMAVELPFSGFKAAFRGRTLEDAMPLDLRQIVQIGILVSKKQLGPFSLFISSIAAYPPKG